MGQNYWSRQMYADKYITKNRKSKTSKNKKTYGNK